ncbi:MAG: endonuclease/exonuclease/phosphatase family protein [bacterium]|nr:endonuclease/exonuclease/phosphatase family protein [bacterium]
METHTALEPEQNTSSKKELQLMTLNIWGGTVLDPLLDFIKTHRDIDIFCFQEVYSCATEMVADFVEDPVVLDIQEKIAAILPDHVPYFRPVLNESYGISTFVYKDILVREEGEHEVHTAENYPGRGPAHSRILQWLKVSIGDQDLTVINLHGLWNGKGKGDAPERILQSNRIKEFTDTLETPFILCGDFNIKPGMSMVK